MKKNDVIIFGIGGKKEKKRRRKKVVLNLTHQCSLCYSTENREGSI